MRARGLKTGASGPTSSSDPRAHTCSLTDPGSARPAAAAAARPRCRIHPDRGARLSAPGRPHRHRGGQGARHHLAHQRRPAPALPGRRSGHPGSGAAARPVRHAAGQPHPVAPVDGGRDDVHRAVDLHLRGHDRRDELQFDRRRLLPDRLHGVVDRGLHQPVGLDPGGVAAVAAGDRRSSHPGDRPDGCGHPGRDDHADGAEHADRAERQQRLRDVRRADPWALQHRAQLLRLTSTPTATARQPGPPR